MHLLVDSDAARVQRATAPIIAKFADLHGVPPADECVAAGPPEVVAARLRSLWDGGAHSVVLRPIGPDPVDQVGRALEALKG
jgi:hypothetical protein